MTSFAALRDHLISAAAAAALLGGGATVIGVRVNDARQDERLVRLEQLNENVEGLRKDLATTREDILRDKLERTREPSK